jgi:hypothetical protein
VPVYSPIGSKCNVTRPMMSASGHKRTFCDAVGMSALPRNQTLNASLLMSALCQKRICGQNLPKGMPAARRSDRHLRHTSVVGLLQLFHDLINTNARWLLAWRELLERFNELCNCGLRRHHKERPPKQEIIVCI